MLPQRKGPEGADVSAPVALHEVGNALTVIMGLLDRAAVAADPEERERLLLLARARADDGRRLTRAAIGAEVEDGPDVGDLVATVREAREGVLARAAGAGVAISVACAPGAAVVAPRAFLQVLTNLLLNALRHSPPGSTVRVACDPGPESVRVRVIDQGPGVPPSVRGRLFDGVTTAVDGAGIGLSCSRALARRAGGDLGLDDAAPGATFALTWPTGALRSSEISSSSPRLELIGVRCLVLDDDGAILDLVDTALAHRGADIVLTKTPAAALAALEARSFDVVLVDLSPFRGEETVTLPRLVASLGGARLVLVTGSVEGSRDPSLPAAARRVMKPFEIRELVRAVHDAFRLDNPGADGA